MPHVNYLAVVVSAVAIFALGGLWYSPMMFAKPWVKLIGMSDEQIKAGGSPSPGMFVQVFLCGALISLVLAVLLNHFINMSVGRGALVGLMCWIGFAGPTYYGTVLFSSKPRALWLIDSGYNLVSFVIAGAILGAWH